MYVDLVDVIVQFIDKFKKTSVPLFCPSCKQVMDKQLDPHYYKSYGSCLDCRTEFETKLKLEGKWEDYVKDTYNKEIDQTIEEYKVFFKEKVLKLLIYIKNFF